jgi:hypothetical protein
MRKCTSITALSFFGLLFSPSYSAIGIASNQAIGNQTHCQSGKRPQCDSAPPQVPQLHPRFFRPPLDGCDWSRSLDGCPLEPQLLENGNHSAAMAPMAHRNYYFLGNSVTRHYAFTLRDFLSGAKHDGHTTTAARREEQKSCAGGSAVGQSSCDLRIRGTQGVVKFMWKNYIG